MVFSDRVCVIRAPGWRVGMGQFPQKKFPQPEIKSGAPITIPGVCTLCLYKSMIFSTASHSYLVSCGWSSLLEPKVLIATPLENCESDLPSYFKTILSLDYPKEAITIAILESDSTDATDCLIRTFISLQPATFSDIVYVRKPVGYDLQTSKRHQRSH